ncbi:hypothetical protein ADUPG1_006842, partial [Aduncisulcus paluster]
MANKFKRRQKKVSKGQKTHRSSPKAPQSNKPAPIDQKAQDTVSRPLSSPYKGKIRKKSGYTPRISKPPYTEEDIYKCCEELHLSKHLVELEIATYRTKVQMSEYVRDGLVSSHRHHSLLYDDALQFHLQKVHSDRIEQAFSDHDAWNYQELLSMSEEEDYCVLASPEKPDIAELLVEKKSEAKDRIRKFQNYYSTIRQAREKTLQARAQSSKQKSSSSRLIEKKIRSHDHPSPKETPAIPTEGVLTVKSTPSPIRSRKDQKHPNPLKTSTIVPTHSVDNPTDKRYSTVDTTKGDVSRGGESRAEDDEEASHAHSEQSMGSSVGPASHAHSSSDSMVFKDEVVRIDEAEDDEEASHAHSEQSMGSSVGPASHAHSSSDSMVFKDEVVRIDEFAGKGQGGISGDKTDTDHIITTMMSHLIDPMDSIIKTNPDFEAVQESIVSGLKAKSLFQKYSYFPYNDVIIEIHDPFEATEVFTDFIPPPPPRIMKPMDIAIKYCQKHHGCVRIRAGRFSIWLPNTVKKAIMKREEQELDDTVTRSSPSGETKTLSISNTGVSSSSVPRLTRSGDNLTWFNEREKTAKEKATEVFMQIHRSENVNRNNNNNINNSFAMSSAFTSVDDNNSRRLSVSSVISSARSDVEILSKKKKKKRKKRRSDNLLCCSTKNSKVDQAKAFHPPSSSFTGSWSKVLSPLEAYMQIVRVQWGSERITGRYHAWRIIFCVLVVISKAFLSPSFPIISTFISAIA